jgi:hypothetical protein
VGLTLARRSAGKAQLRSVAELIPIEAIDRSGVVVTSDGALTRIVHVTPSNPLILSSRDRDDTAEGFCHLAARLRPGQVVQLYVQARPVNLEDVLASSRREVAHWAGPPPEGAQPTDQRSLDRWRLYAAMEESLRLHADDQAAVRFDAYMIVPFVPEQSGARRALAEIARYRGGATASALERDIGSHTRALRQSLAHTDALRAELDAMNMTNRLLDGEEVLELLWARSARRVRRGAERLAPAANRSRRAR